MKRLLVINPNTSKLFTQRIAAVAQRAAPECAVETVSPRSGPRRIASAYDELLSCAPTLETYLEARRSGPVDGVVVACFSDHAVLEGLREIADGPVVGLLDAACATAALVGETFGIAATSPSWEPRLWTGVARLGYRDRCVDIRAMDLALEEDDEQALRDATAAIASDVVILGGAGFDTDLARRAAAATGAAVVEPVEAAVRLCAALALQGLGSAHARPLAQQLDGLSSILAEAYVHRGGVVVPPLFHEKPPPWRAGRSSTASAPPPGKERLPPRCAGPKDVQCGRGLSLYRRALRAARRCVPGQAEVQEHYARNSFRANVSADARRAKGLLVDAEDQIAFGESLLRRRAAEDAAPVAAVASPAAAPVTAVASVAPPPREADDLLAYDDYLDGDALDRRLGS